MSVIEGNVLYRQAYIKAVYITRNWVGIDFRIIFMLKGNFTTYDQEILVAVAFLNFFFLGGVVINRARGV